MHKSRRAAAAYNKRMDEIFKKSNEQGHTSLHASKDKALKKRTKKDDYSEYRAGGGKSMTREQFYSRSGNPSKFK